MDVTFTTNFCCTVLEKTETVLDDIHSLKLTFSPLNRGAWENYFPFGFREGNSFLLSWGITKFILYIFDTDSSYRLIGRCNLGPMILAM